MNSSGRSACGVWPARSITVSLHRSIKELGKNAEVQRMKGLGEMNAEELWQTTMNPETRVLLRVTVDDAAAANEIFEKLMGPDVEPRKKFIQAHAKSVRNLDI